MYCSVGIGAGLESSLCVLIMIRSVKESQVIYPKIRGSLHLRCGEMGETRNRSEHIDSRGARCDVDLSPGCHPDVTRMSP